MLKNSSFVTKEYYNITDIRGFKREKFCMEKTELVIK